MHLSESQVESEAAGSLHQSKHLDVAAPIEDDIFKVTQEDKYKEDRAKSLAERAKSLADREEAEEERLR